VLVQNVFRKCVVFIGTGTGESFRPGGTGFVISCGKSLYVVTARHVIASAAGLDRARKISIRLNREHGGTDCKQFDFCEWQFDAQELEATDTAVLPAPWLRRQEYVFAHVPWTPEAVLTDAVRDSFAVGVGDEIFITGLFTNHHGQSKNIPVVRIGNISLMPDEPIATKLGFMTAYLVEARSLAGLSGSPVFVHFGPLRSWRRGNEKMMMPAGESGGFLLGLMHGHFDASGADAVIEVPTDGKEPRGIHTGMGIVVPAQRITGLLLSIGAIRAGAISATR
jgi:hypothetical protein